MSTSVITGKITENDGTTGLDKINVTCILRPRPAFETATGIELPSIRATRTDSTGTYTFTLVRTADITPSGSYYEITENIPDKYGGVVQHIIQVGAVPATVYASLVSPTTIVPGQATYLTQAAADLRYVLSPGSFGTGTVESRPNDVITNGVLAAYARTDHRHDRETTFGTAATRAAQSGTDLYEGRLFRETDGLRKLYTYRNATDLQVADMFIVADIAAKAAIANPYQGMRVRQLSDNLLYFYDGSGWFLEGEQLISRTILGSAATSISTGTFPVVDNAGDLKIVFYAANSGGSGIDSSCQFNGDAGANYTRQYIFGQNATGTAGQVNAATSLGAITTSNDSANRFSVSTLLIPNYRSAFHKSGTLLMYDARNGTTTQIVLSQGFFWANTAALTSVVLFAGANNLITGSYIEVYARSTKG